MQQLAVRCRSGFLPLATSSQIVKAANAQGCKYRPNLIELFNYDRVLNVSEMVMVTFNVNEC